MNRYCSQCATPLKRNISICPKCGHKNSKIKSIRKNISLYISLIIIAILISGGFILKDKIIYFFTNYKDIIAQINDVDFDAKRYYKISHEKYLMNLYWFESSSGYDINGENAKDFDTVNYKLDGDTTLTSTELINNRLSVLKRIDEGNCYSLLNVDNYCDQLRNEIIDLNRKIYIKIDTKSTESRFCGSTNFPHFISTCENSQNWAINHNIYTTCQNCDEKIEELVRLSSKIKDPDLSQVLLEYTMILKDYNETSSKIIEKHKEILEWDNAIGGNENELRIVKDGSVTKLLSYYKKEEFGSFNIDMLKSNCPSLSKTCVINDLNGNIQRIRDQQKQVVNNLSELTDKESILNDQIRTYANIINGKYGLNLSIIR